MERGDDHQTKAEQRAVIAEAVLYCVVFVLVSYTLWFCCRL
jgi:hypothetical protein